MFYDSIQGQEKVTLLILAIKSVNINVSITVVSRCQELHFSWGLTGMDKTMTCALYLLQVQVNLNSDTRLAANDAKYAKIGHVALSGNLFNFLFPYHPCWHPSAFFTLNNIQPLLQLQSQSALFYLGLSEQYESVPCMYMQICMQSCVSRRYYFGSFFVVCTAASGAEAPESGAAQ